MARYTDEEKGVLVIIVIVIIVGWFLYNNYTSGQRYDRERAYCVSSATTDGWGHTASSCYGLSNSDLDSMYKVGQ